MLTPKKNIFILWCLFAEQIEQDIETATNALEEARAGLAKLHKELKKLQEQLTASEVCKLNHDLVVVFKTGSCLGVWCGAPDSAFLRKTKPSFAPLGPSPLTTDFGTTS
jgi:hypothetical protein